MHYEDSELIEAIKSEMQLHFAHNLDEQQLQTAGENALKRYKRDHEEEVNGINWGYNCLTDGVHHGRPDAIWNIPLRYAVQIFHRAALKELVISRIYNDAKQIVEHADMAADWSNHLDWAEQIRDLAERDYSNTIQHKVGELTRYYDSPMWEGDQQDAAHRVTENMLNPHYEPLHSHDTINMLCRILGMSARMSYKGT